MGGNQNPQIEQHNGQKKKDKATIYKTFHRKLKIKQDEPH